MKTTPTIDPYKELKAAWVAGRKIRYVRDDGSTTPWLHKGCGMNLAFSEPVNRYETEAIPTDPLAEVKDAHARGEKIEALCLFPGENEWFVWAKPVWSDNYEYRIAPSPAPAGKLTDEQLGELGAKAAGETSDVMIGTDPLSEFYHEGEPARTAFAHAVAAEVRKESEAEIQRLKEEASNENDWAEMYQNKALELGKERDKRINAENHLKACLAVMPCGNLAEHTAESLPERIAELARRLAEESLESEDLKKRLTALEWRPASVKPTQEDADSQKRVQGVDIDGECFMFDYRSFPGCIEKWRPATPPPAAPTAEEVSRVEFERWATEGNNSIEKLMLGDYAHHVVQMRWEGWQARASKEVKA